jgi:hypothetical protein
MDRIGACGHTTFGGRLSADAKGFPAAAMAKKLSGDWRNPELIRAWTHELVRDLPHARPRPAIDPPARSLARLLGYGVIGWALCAALMGLLLQTVPDSAAVALHAVAAPLIFTGLAVNYFRARGSREPRPTAIAFTATVAVLDAVIVAGLVLRDFAMFASFAGTWLPFGLILLVTWITGLTLSMMPAPRPAAAADRSPSAPRQRESGVGA